ncbi:MAG: type IV pilus secretin PilQ [Candidatus Krumholzibacteria bacterium]|nr:type IV pilus secretin PilQ [Candidatus Krumholzibacteria bacterium]
MSIRRFALVIIAGLVLPGLGLAAVSEINGVKVVPEGEKVRLEISKVGDIQFKAFTMSNPDRLVVDCVGAMYDVRSVDDYPENGIVSNVRTSQYQNDPTLISRVVVDLKTKVDWKIYESGDYQVVELTPRGTVRTASADAAPTLEVKPVAKPEPAKPKYIPLAGAEMGPVLPMTTPEEKPVTVQQTRKKKEEPKEEDPWVKDEPVETKTEMINSAPARAAKARTTTNWTQNYVRGAPASGGGLAMGQRKITLDAQGADIKTVLRTISDFAGVNIVSGQDVEGDVYVHIKDTPWEEALDILLKAYGYAYREEFGMIRVAETQALMKEELDEKTAERKKDDLLPLVTKIIFVNNSNAEEMRMALENIVSQRGMISVDEGSNSLIINDIEKNIEKIEGMVRELDRRTYQVDINAKLVEIDVEASRELGIDWALMNLASSTLDGTGSAEVTSNIATSATKLTYGTVQSWGEFAAVFKALEKSNKANLISNPRITTMDNREASILVGKEIPLIVADEAGNPITELTKIGIMLRVTPHVNADRTITLDLHPEVSDLQSEATAQGGVIITTSEADTRVIVGDGETAVIGGLIKEIETEYVSGVPILKDVPFVGWFFSSKSKVSKQQELVIFVTPTIVE